MFIKYCQCRTSSIYIVSLFLIFFRTRGGKMTQQKNRKDLVHVRAFTTISTKNETASCARRPTIFHARRKLSCEGSFGGLTRALTFESPGSPRKMTIESDVLCVKAVSSNFVSISRPSAAIERLMEKRKNSHQTALEEMRNELSDAHEKCEKTLRVRSERIKIDLNCIRENIEEYQDKIKNTDLSTLRGKDLETTWNTIKALITEQERIIDEFHDSLIDIERDRKFLVKRVLQRYYDIIHSISYILPFEIQALLENEIQEYNERILDNFKVYEDLHLRMFLLADSQNRELHNWLEETNDRRRDAICLANVKRLTHKKETMKNPDQIFVYDPAGISARNELSSKLNLLQDRIKIWYTNILIFEESSVSDCSKELREAVEQSKTAITKLVDVYNFGLQKMWEKYKNEVTRLKEDKNCVLENDARILDEAVQSLQDFYKIVADKFQDLCDRNSNALEVKVEEFCQFLSDSNSTRKQQVARLTVLQESVGRFVEDLMIKSQKNIAGLETKLNSYCQQLRQSTNEENMKELLSQIFSTLDLILEEHKSSYEEEREAVQHYVQTVFDEIPKIIKQFDGILASHNCRDSTENAEETSETDLPEVEPNFLREQLDILWNLAYTISCWKATLIAEIVNFCEDFPKTTRNAAEVWQNTILFRRSHILESKMHVDSQRREEIKVGIYDLRITEIEEHSERLKNHENEMNQVLKDSSDCLEKFLEERKESLQICERNIFETSHRLSTTKSTVQLKRLQKEIENIRQEYKNEMDQKMQMYRTELCDILDSLMTKNENFLHDIQLFKDDGNFSTTEAKSFQKSLAAFGKDISKSKTASEQKAEKFVGELNRTVDKFYNAAVEMCSSKMRELQFYEDAHRVKTKCAVVIERQAHCLLHDNTIFFNDVISRFEQSMKGTCDASDLKILADETSRLLASLDAKLDNLTVVFPMVKSNSIEEEDKPRRKSPAQIKKMKQQKSLNKVMNYRNLFLGSDEIPVSKNSFWVTAMHTMGKTIEEIQTKATKFFTSTAKRTKTEAGYNEYMQQTLQQMNCYREQLENLWRQEAQDLLAAANALERSVYKCILITVNDFHDQRLEETKTMIKKELAELDEIMRVWSTRRDDLLASFKVSHGHPGRRDSLNKFIEEVHQEEERMQNTAIEKLGDFKNNLEKLASSYEISLLELANPLRNIISKLKHRAKRERLREILARRVESNLPISEEFLHPLDIGDRSDRHYPQCRRSFGAHVDDSLDLESTINQLVEKVKQGYRSAVEEAEGSVHTFVQAGEQFKEHWKSSMNVVAQVYEIIL